MTTSQSKQLVVHSRVTPWGFLMALVLAVAFAVIGYRTLEAGLLPSTFGVFVEPPPWLMGAMLFVFAAFLLLIGVAEFAHYVKPSVEVVLDGDGIATYGVLGERRYSWRDVVGAEAGTGLLLLKVRGRGRVPPPDVKLYFNRLDVDPAELLTRIDSSRPDLLAAIRA